MLLLRRGPRPHNFPVISRRFASTLRLSGVRVGKVQLLVGASAVGLLAIGTGILLTDRATHHYAQDLLKRRATVVDPDVLQWEWNADNDEWPMDDELSGNIKNAIREAWILSHRLPDSSPSLESGENVVDAMYQQSETALRSLISLVEAHPPPNPSTLVALLIQHAEALGKLGQNGLVQSKDCYERIWEMQGGVGIQAARTAYKLGNIFGRLGQKDALNWWTRSLQLAGGNAPFKDGVPITPPSTPAAQRIVALTLVSLSAHYATTNQLKAARKIELSGLEILRSIETPQSLASTTPAQSLHYLTLLQRSAILSSHLAEVSYAQRRPPSESLQHLENAAHSSERVAFALVGTPIRDEMTPSTIESLLPQYADNDHLQLPARRLLGEAQRSAALSWNLMGRLTEKMDSALALSYYTRALSWAGNLNAPSSTMMREEWSDIQKNYQRLSR
ncbi:hypothetical protein MIND_01032100 [Mycena indigotica]|uniref:Uncharacterized protein n=1 Tax=Mycena indigotica TaxID=2126181 RepID=A0A8H6SBS4_9AGAR|nr:uncharacterized protein MIND_01032100 [Mycena indigotica]KAF7294940.1 hypothetical protein MIND_01032100 [Mycena indigotica]